MKKGFTLIELLAVIVILAVIALVTVPMIMGVIDKAKKGALKDSAYGIIEAANLYYSQSLESASNDITFTCDNEGCLSGENELSYKGAISGTGSIILFADGKTALCINGDKYSAIKNVEDTSVSVVQGSCEYDEETNAYINMGVVSQNVYDEMVENYEAQIDALEASQLDTTDATATATDIVSGKTAYANGLKIIGTKVPTFDIINNTAGINVTYMAPPSLSINLEAGTYFLSAYFYIAAGNGGAWAHTITGYSTISSLKTYGTTQTYPSQVEEYIITLDKASTITASYINAYSEGLNRIIYMTAVKLN